MQQNFTALIDEFGKSFSLTERETEITHLLAKKIVLPEKIANELGISVNTVNNHLKKLFAKTGTNNKADLLAAIILFLNKNKNSKQKKLKVLIIDDENDFCDTLSRFLETKGVETHSSYCPINAIEESKKISVDVVISDIRMPSMNGVQLLQELRKAHYYEPGVIFLSGYSGDYSLEDLLDKGAIGFLEKPADFEKIYQMIVNYAGREEEPAIAPAKIKNISPYLENTLTLDRNTIGFGGFFLPTNAIKESLKPASLKCGDIVGIDFQLQNSKEKHSSVCEIAWIRLNKNKKQGIGLRFLSLPGEAKKEVSKFVRQHKIMSFIPSCNQSLAWCFPLKMRKFIHAADLACGR